MFWNGDLMRVRDLIMQKHTSSQIITAAANVFCYEHLKGNFKIINQFSMFGMVIDAYPS